MKILKFVVAAFLIPAFAYAASYNPSIKWMTIKTDHFEVHFDQKLEPQAQLAAKYLEEAYTIYSPKFMWKPWGKTQVMITDNFDTANGLTSTLPYKWIVLRLAAPDPDGILADYDNWLRTLVMHEYAHIMHLDQVGGVMWGPRFILGRVIAPNGSTPGWIREGVPTYMETVETTAGRGRSSYAEMMLRTDILNNDFLKIDEADGLQWKWPEYRSMYIYGVKFMQYLVDKYGEDKFFEFHHEMARSLLLFAVNHQARHVFNNVPFESRKVHNRYVRQRKEGSPESQTFYDLWKEWRESLEKKYAMEKDKLSKLGLTEFRDVAGGGTILSSPAVSPDGKYLAYARYRVKGPAEFHLLDLKDGNNKVIKKGRLPTSIAFGPDGKKMVYTAIGGYKTYNAYGDIYLYDVEKKKHQKLTSGQRAVDTAFFPDGERIIFSKQDKGQSSLAVYDIKTKKILDLLPKAEDGDPNKLDFTQCVQPVVSPDGKKVAFIAWRLNEKQDMPYPVGEWDLYVADFSGDKISNVRRLTNDKAIDTKPEWSKDGESIYYSSDKSGINNIYRIDLKSKSKKSGVRDVQITNVLTGVFQPVLSSDGTELFVQYYNGYGYDIRKTRIGDGRDMGVIPANVRRDTVLTGETGGSLPKVARQSASGGGMTGEKAAGAAGGTAKPAEVTGMVSGMTSNGEYEPLQLPSKKYKPLGKSLLLPRFVIPSFATVDDGVMIGAFTGGADPLRWHNWLGGLTYRTDLSDYIGYYFSYFYNRFKPVFSTGIMGYAVNFGNITFLNPDSTTSTVHLFEERRRLYGGVSYPWKKHSVGMQYFWEYRKPNSGLTTAQRNALNFGNYAGFNLIYNYGSTQNSPASISTAEKGEKVRMNFLITDADLGSDENNEQRVFVGEYKEYFKLPWANNVIATKISGGMTWGDQFAQGTFTMGGSLGEGMFGGGGSLYYFPLRGLPVASLSRTRAMLFSVEYRLPLIRWQRGFGTLPLFIKDIHIAPFADYGNAWNANTDMGNYFFDNFFLGTGLEIRGDFIIGHGLPVAGRVGYGVIVVNRDRLGNVQDPILKHAAKDGVLILELGTSF